MSDTLFGDEEPARKPRARKRPTETDPAVKACIDAFHSGFKARFGFAPLTRQYGRFGKELVGLLADWGEAEVLALLADFFRVTDPLVLRSNYEPGDFVRLAQRLKLRRNGTGTVSARTADNLDASVRATQRRRPAAKGAIGDGDPG